MSFDAFISYSHAADGRLAPALQRALQRLAKPWYRLRALRVFRDESALSANPHLWSSIQTAMDESEWFVLLASPDAVSSQWVNRELIYWLTNKSAEHILVVVTDGTWEWDGNAHALMGTAVPDALREGFGDEPRHVDLRWAATETDLDMHHARFRDVVAQLAAPIHGIAKDDLDSEDVRQHRRARRLARGGFTALTLLVVVSLVATTFAVIQRAHANHNAHVAQHERSIAEQQALVADSGRLAALAVDRVATQLDLALLLAIQSHQLHDSTATRSALLTALEYSPHLVELKHGFGKNASAVDLSPDHTRAAVGGRDGTLAIWDLRTMKQVTPVIAAHKASIMAVAFSDDGKRIATGGADNHARVWDAATLRPIFTVEASPIAQVSFSPNGRLLAVGTTQGISLWSVPSGAPASVHFDDTWFAFSPDAKTLAGGLDGAELFDRFTGANLAAFRFRLGDLVSAVAFSVDGSRIAIGTNSGAYLLDAKTRTQIGSELTGGNGIVRSLAFSPDDRVVAAGDSDGRVVRWDVATGAQIGGPLAGFGWPVERVAFAGDSRIIAASVVGVATWELAHDPLAESAVVSGGLTDLAVPTYGPVATAHDGGVQLWDPARPNDRTASSLRSPAGSAAVGMTADGTVLAVGVGGGVQLWDVKKRSQVGLVKLGPLDTFNTHPLVFSPDGRLLAVAESTSFIAARGDITLIDVQGRKRLRVIHGNPHGVPFEGLSALAFSPDSRTLATTGFDGVLHLWDVRTGDERVQPAPPQPDPLADVAFTRDGSRVVTAGGDGYIVFWDVATGRPVGDPLIPSNDPLAHVDVSPDGATLAAVSQKNVLTFWDLASHQRIGPLLAVGPDTATVAQTNSPGAGPPAFYAAHGNILVTGAPSTFAGTTTLQFWDMRPDTWQRKACQLAGRNLTRAEWTQYIGTGPYRRTCPQWPAGL